MEVRCAPVPELVMVTIALLTGNARESHTVLDKVAIFPCAEAIDAQPRNNKHSLITVVSHLQAVAGSCNPVRIEVDTPTPCLRCMSPPIVAPTDLPLPLAVAGYTAVSG